MKVIVNPAKKGLKYRQEKFYENSKFHLLADVIFLLLILIFVGILVFLYTFHPKANVALEAVLVDGKVASGQIANFEITYKNNEKNVLKNTSLAITFPKNFVLISALPEKDFSDQTNTFKIGDLDPGANGKIKISGIVYGEIGTSGFLAYSLNYSENKLVGNTLGSLVFPIDSSALSVAFSSPNEIYKGFDFGGKITLKNYSATDINQEIDLAFTNPSLIIKKISSDKAVLINNVIQINSIKAGESIDIDVQANTDSDEGPLKLSLNSYLNLDGNKLKQQSVEKTFNVVVPKFKLTITPDKEVINNEEAVNFKVEFVNEEKQEIKNISLDVESSDDNMILKSLSLKDGADKYEINGSTININSLPVGDKDYLSFDAILSRQTVVANQETGIAINVKYELDNRTVKYKIYSPGLKILSDLKVSSKAVYYSAQGDQLGVGPLPPVVGVPTSYWIFWEVDNDGNDVNNFTVSAELPDNVVWTNQKSLLAGKLRFGEIGRKAVWTIDDLVPSGGKYRAGFEVQLVPTSNDLGKVPTLLTNTQYSADDIFVDQGIVGQLSNVDANLKDDPVTSGKGKVIKLDIVK